MADTDIIKADPIKVLQDASKISLIGGGALFVAAMWLLNQVNEHDWKVSGTVTMVLIIGSIFMGVVAAGLKALDAMYRAHLTGKVIDKFGPGDLDAIKQYLQALEMPLIHMLEKAAANAPATPPPLQED